MVAEMEHLEKVVLKLFDIEAIKFGEFKLKSGLLSPIYINLRVIIGFPKLLRELSELLFNIARKNGASFDMTCGVPYTALPLATCMSLDHDIPMVIRRREAKDYGTKQMIEGVYKDGDVCLVVEDVVTSGGSVLETVKELNNARLTCKDAVVLLDRGQGGKEMLKANGINLHSIFEMKFVLDVLLRHKKIEQNLYDQCLLFIKTNQFEPIKKVDRNDASSKVLSYAERKSLVTNAVAKKIFDVMETKQTNLAFSVDVTKCAEVLRLVDSVGPHCCIVKTHVDILVDFNPQFVASLLELAVKHNFVLFEDRKFADIGNTVKHQYSGGLYNIVDWAELTNAHAVPGDGVVKGLKAASGSKERACLLIAQMSSTGALTDATYTSKTVEMAKKSDDDFVIGFISTSRVHTDDCRFIHMTPGVSLKASGDSLGQNYLSPEEVIKNRACDVIIVGRGIYEAADPAETAAAYKAAGYKAYTEMLNAV